MWDFNPNLLLHLRHSDCHVGECTCVEKKFPREEGKEFLKKKCQTDLAFLSNCVLRSRKQAPLVERVHGKIIDQFIKKDPSISITDALDQISDIKEKVILASRGMLKSTLGMADLTQWILCYPNIRILVLSGIQSKAESILEGAIRPFMSNEVIQYLFPEWIVSYSDAKKETFLCPNRDHDLNYRDETLTISTFGSVKAGGHYELLHLDDCTNEQNCATQESVEKTVQQYDDLDPLIEPGGFVQILATTWAIDDLPEYVRIKGEENKVATGVTEFSYFSLPAWTLKQGDTPEESKAILDREKLGSLKSSDVNLTWPEKLTWKYLAPKYRKNREKFYKQYLLRAGINEVVHFSEALFDRQTIPYTELPKPHDRELFIFWDMGGIWTKRRAKSQSDYSCGIAVMFERSTGRMYVYDAILTRFANDVDAANTIIDFYLRQIKSVGKVQVVAFEDAAGIRYLTNTLNQTAAQAGVNVNFDFITPDNTEDAKNGRIMTLAGAMSRSLVFFITSCSYLDDMKPQFIRWLPSAKRRKDDAPDAVATAWQTFGSRLAPVAQPPIPTPNGPILSWEPDPDAPPEVVDPHADERENADIDWLSKFTVPHV